MTIGISRDQDLAVPGLEHLEMRSWTWRGLAGSIFLGLVLLLTGVFVVRIKSGSTVERAAPRMGGDEVTSNGSIRGVNAPNSDLHEQRISTERNERSTRSLQRGELLVTLLSGEAPAGDGIPVVLKQFDPPSEVTSSTDPGGIARFEDPRPGPAIVRVDAEAMPGMHRPGLEPLDEESFSIDAELELQRRDPPLYERLDIPEAGDVHVTLRMQPPGAVLGALMGPFGEGVAHALVILLFEGAALGRFELRALTDATGSFSFPVVRPGAYRLQVSMNAQNPPLDVQGRSMLEHAAPPRTDVQVDPGETTHVVVAFGSGTHELRGQVVDPLGIAQSGLPVMVYAGDASQDLSGPAADRRPTDWGDLVAFVETDGEGQFTIHGVHAGSYRVQVDPFGFESPPGVARLARWPSPVTTTVTEGASLVRIPAIVVVPSEPCTLESSLAVASGWRPGEVIRFGDFMVMARLASAPVRGLGKRYPWRSRVTREGWIALTIERGGSEPDAIVELSVVYVPTGESKEFVIDMPREDAVVLPAVHFP